MIQSNFITHDVAVKKIISNMDAILPAHTNVNTHCPFIV